MRAPSDLVRSSMAATSLTASHQEELSALRHGDGPFLALSLSFWVVLGEPLCAKTLCFQAFWRV